MPLMQSTVHSRSVCLALSLSLLPSFLNIFFHSSIRRDVLEPGRPSLSPTQMQRRVQGFLCALGDSPQYSRDNRRVYDKSCHASSDTTGCDCALRSSSARSASVKAPEMEDTKPKKKIHTDDLAIEPNDQYAASYLKTGSTSGIMYQMKMLTCVTWRLMCKTDVNWLLATEVRNARGFHDLVLKYTTNDTPNGDGSTSDGKYMYRFMQIKHRSSLKKNASITDFHLTSKNKAHRQGSLFYLFKSYVNMLGNFEKITPDQIVDLTVFTNMNINQFKFLVPVENDNLYGFEGKGKRYRIDIRALQKVPGIMICLYNINPDDNIIFGFLRKLVFLVCQPSESELEELIVEEMGKTFNAPQIFYNNLYKNIINWFLVYEAGKAPYLTDNHVMKYLKDTQDVLWEAKKAEMLVDPVSKISDKLKLLSL